MSITTKKSDQPDSSKLKAVQKPSQENHSDKKDGSDKKPGDKGSEKDPNLPKVWRRSEVEILIKWGEIAACYRYLHELSFRMYQTQNYCFTMPVIIVSTLSGTASFSTTLFPVGMQPFVPMVVGMLNIGVGIVQTISQFLKIAEMSEGHRVAAIAYGKFSRNISTELSLSEQNRSYDGYEFVQICRSEIDRLIEQSPIIPIEVLQGFDTNSRFNNIKYKPDILGITPITEGNFDVAKKEINKPHHSVHLDINQKNPENLEIKIDDDHKVVYEHTQRPSMYVHKENKDVVGELKNVLNNKFGEKARSLSENLRNISTESLNPVKNLNFKDMIVRRKKEMIQSANEKTDNKPHVNFSMNAFSSVIEIEKEKTKVDSEDLEILPVIPFEEERLSNDTKIDIVSETTVL